MRGVLKEAMSKEAMSKEAMSKEAMSKEAMSKEAMSKEAMSLYFALASIAAGACERPERGMRSSSRG
jgi:hypothetical protein